MQGARFHIGLVAVLALGLGFSLSSSEAIGYPSGTTVSMGENPVWSVGGQHSSSAPHIVITAPDDQDAVVTDVVLSFGCGSCTSQVDLKAGGQNLGSFMYRQLEHYGASRSHTSTPVPIAHSYRSGLHVPAGESLTIEVSYSAVNYSLSGYYAQP